MSGPVSVVAIVAVVTLCGLGVLALLGVARSPSALAPRAGLAPLAGMAWVGAVAAVLGAAGIGLGLTGLGVVTLVTGAVGGARLARGAGSHGVTRVRAQGRSELVVVAASIGLIALVLAHAVALFRVKPLAEYDGWAMWGMKARALATLGSADPAVFASDAYARLHLEYPLLLPALHSLPLQAATGFSSNTIVLSCLAVGLAGLLALWAALMDRVRPAVLLVFVALIATMPAFFGQLSTGYADVPLAVFVALGVVAAARWLLDDDGAWLALATLFLAASALTKNEGLLYAAALYVALFAVAGGRRKRVGASVLVVAVAYLPWRVHTAVHGLGAPDYDLSSSFDLPWLVPRLDRAPVAGEGLLRHALDRGEFGVVAAVGLAATAMAFALGARRIGGLAAGFVLLSFGGLVWIYVLTPNDVAIFLSFNGSRIVVSLVVGLAALCPLLVHESLRARRERSDLVGREPGQMRGAATGDVVPPR